MAHWLWNHARVHFARHVQSRISEGLGVDIHPAAKIGRGVMPDHGSGLLIGETAVVEGDVSILQNVTLGSTGKDTGDRHPKIRHGAPIGAGRGRHAGYVKNLGQVACLLWDSWPG